MYMSIVGSLYFANVMLSDKREGKMYVCNLHNKALRTFSQGGDQIINPRVSEDEEAGSGDGEDITGTCHTCGWTCMGVVQGV